MRARATVPLSSPRLTSLDAERQLTRDDLHERLKDLQRRQRALSTSSCQDWGHETSRFALANRDNSCSIPTPATERNTCLFSFSVASQNNHIVYLCTPGTGMYVIQHLTVPKKNPDIIQKRCAKDERLKIKVLAELAPPHQREPPMFDSEAKQEKDWKLIG
jgi:hypothetical protein